MVVFFFKPRVNNMCLLILFLWILQSHNLAFLVLSCLFLPLPCVFILFNSSPPGHDMTLTPALILSLLQVKSPTLATLTDDSGHTLTSSDFNLRCLTPDKRVEGLLAFSSHEELDRLNQETRQGNRHPELFALYPPPDEVRYKNKVVFFFLFFFSINISAAAFAFHDSWDLQKLPKIERMYNHFCQIVNRKFLF